MQRDAAGAALDLGAILKVLTCHNSSRSILAARLTRSVGRQQKQPECATLILNFSLALLLRKQVNREYIGQVIGQFNQAIQKDDVEDVFATYFTLLHQAQCVILDQVIILQGLSLSLSKSNEISVPDLTPLPRIIQYVSNTTDDETQEILQYIKNRDAHHLLLWYQQRWNSSQVTYTDVLQSVAGSLRTVMTALSGHIELIRRYIAVDTSTDYALSEIQAVVDMMRNTRSKLAVFLDSHDRPTQPYGQPT